METPKELRKNSSLCIPLSMRGPLDFRGPHPILAGIDFWGAAPWEHRKLCVRVGASSLRPQNPNLNFRKPNTQSC